MKDERVNVEIEWWLHKGSRIVAMEAVTDTGERWVMKLFEKCTRVDLKD